jgi:hypothetical protein
MGGRKINKKNKAISKVVINRPSQPSLKSMLLLALLSLCWHGFILTNDGTFWDSWFVKDWLKERNSYVIKQFFGSVGMPIYGLIYIPFAFFANIVQAFMIATVVCLLAQTILTYLLVFKLGRLSEKESFCLTVLAASIPVFTAGQDFIMFFFVFTHTLFLLSAYIAVQGLESSNYKCMLLRFVALLMFFISFYNAALLVFYGGFFTLLFFKQRKQESLSFIKSLGDFFLRHLDFFLLPPVAWILRQITTPQFGWYADYNSPTANIPFILPSLKSFFINVIPFHAGQIWNSINENPVIILALILAVSLAVIVAPDKCMLQRNKVGTSAMLGFGVLLLFFAIFPFAAAGKGFSPQPIGEPSRYTILTGLPLAILIFSGIRLVFLFQPGKPSRWPAPICFVIAFVLGCQIPPVYLAERVEWVYSRSILHNLKEMDEIKKSSIVVLQNCGMTSEIIYGIYAFKSIFGQITRLVTPIAPQNGLYFSPSEILMQLQRTTMLPNLLNSIDPSGKQVLVVAQRNNNLSNWKIASEYLSLYWNNKNEEMSAFLSNLTKLKTQILKPATPTHYKNIETALKFDKECITNSVGITMVEIPEDHIWVARTETSQEQFTKVMRFNPSLFQDLNRPVERVSWYRAMEFCRLLTAIEKKSGRLPEGFVYRLPSMAEFNKFSQKGLDNDNVLARDSIFWTTEPVGSKTPNSFGLCDTLGNVWEWTIDWGDALKTMKVSAGGGFANFPNELQYHPQREQTMDFFSRAMVRRFFGPTRSDHPDQSSWDRGFRVILARPIEY